MPFDVLHDRTAGITSETLYKPIPVERPPVYNTERLLKPLQDLIEYSSPVNRALRQKAIAQANFDYRAYLPGGMHETDAYWRHRIAKANIDRYEAQARRGHAGELDNDGHLEAAMADQ